MERSQQTSRARFLQRTLEWRYDALPRAAAQGCVAWTIIGDTPLSKTFRGVDGIENGLLGPVFKQIDPSAGVHVEIIELIAEGDKVVARAQGTIKGLYGPYNNTYCHVFTVRGWQIVEDIEYLDTLLIERALYGRKLA